MWNYISIPIHIIMMWSSTEHRENFVVSLDFHCPYKEKSCKEFMAGLYLLLVWGSFDMRSVQHYTLTAVMHNEFTFGTFLSLQSVC